MLVVFLRGLNVGGHRSFRPATLAKELRGLDAVNIGAAGTLVIRRPVSRATVRREIARRLPFDAAITICDGREIRRLVSLDPFAGQPLSRDIVHFVSVLPRRPRKSPRFPIHIPSRNAWLVRVLGRDGRFVFGKYKRQMKVIGSLGALDGIFAVPVTTRNWKTMLAVARSLGQAPRSR